MRAPNRKRFRNYVLYRKRNGKRSRVNQIEIFRGWLENKKKKKMKIISELYNTIWRASTVSGVNKLCKNNIVHFETLTNSLFLKKENVVIFQNKLNL